MQLATKFGVVKFDVSGLVINGTPEYVRACCEASLKRLDVEYIDLYYQHRVDTTIPIEDTVSNLLPSFLISLSVVTSCRINSYSGTFCFLSDGRT